MAAYGPELDNHGELVEDLFRELARFRVVDLSSLEVTIVNGPRGPEAQLTASRLPAPALRRT
jgi:hypothetical protein